MLSAGVWLPCRGDRQRFRFGGAPHGPFLARFGVSEHRALIEVDRASVRFCSGRVDPTVPLANRAAVGRAISGRPGIAHRAGGALTIAGSDEGMLRIGLRGPHRMRFMLLPVCVRRIYTSPEDPEALTDAIRTTQGAADGAWGVRG